MENLLFTGGTGFLGKNARPILDTMYNVSTCGITPDDTIKANLAKEIPALDQHYDVVLHACGKAHIVPRTEEEKQELDALMGNAAVADTSTDQMIEKELEELKRKMNAE